MCQSRFDFHIKLRHRGDGVVSDHIYFLLDFGGMDRIGIDLCGKFITSFKFDCYYYERGDIIVMVPVYLAFVIYSEVRHLRLSVDRGEVMRHSCCTCLCLTLLGHWLGLGSIS